MKLLCEDLLDLVGNTPVVKLDSDICENGINLFAKLEGFNPTGSIKDRPAAYIIRHLILNEKISTSSTIVESSSGNFGIALSAVCRAKGINFVCVTDKNCLENSRYLIKQYGGELVCIDEEDKDEPFLKKRIKKAKEIERETNNCIWINQYENMLNSDSHYFGTAMEIYKVFSDMGLDYAFVAVSSGGTISGVSNLLKKLFPKITIIAVDVEGSVIFNGHIGKRKIPGLGASMRPPLVNTSIVDHVMKISETDIIDHCNKILSRYGIFAGGSSGAVYCAARRYFKENKVNITSSVRHKESRRNAVLIFPDRGDRYCDTIYNSDWVSNQFREESQVQLLAEV